MLSAASILKKSSSERDSSQSPTTPRSLLAQQTSKKELKVIDSLSIQIHKVRFDTILITYY
jgi:hypothetical protein